MYLIPADLKKSIQAENLTQIIGSDQTILTSAELTAIEEATSYLVQRYDLTEEFQDTPAWDKTQTYKAGNRVYMDAPAFDAATTYVADMYVSYQSSIYKSIAGSAPDTFHSDEWKLACPQFQIFYAELPFPKFNVYTVYSLGNQVFWKDKTYTAAVATRMQSIKTDIQIAFIEAKPLPNIFPDDAINGSRFWGAGVAYAVAANTDILNTTKWTKGDNRSQQLITVLVDIALYHVHSRIAPRNIPDVREKRRDDAIKWLKMAGQGAITANLPVLQPKQGNRTRYGGNVKNINSYHHGALCI